jgi:ubiquinone/menaquinone biosynthesis C-methylase UbiE
MQKLISPFIEETRFGNWFIRSGIWKEHVITRALDLLQPMLPQPTRRFARILDIGCGFGHSFALLAERFGPDEIVALDADPELEQRARAAAARCPCKVRLHAANAARIDLPDQSFDMVFCHQSFHHIIEQEAAMAEFFRVLKPGGVLLFAESTRRYIHSLIIRAFFRHPMEVQKSAEEYIAIIRQAGFDLPASRINFPYLWWSREDLGFFETIGLLKPPPVGQREETLINAVCIKPA